MVSLRNCENLRACKTVVITDLKLATLQEFTETSDVDFAWKIGASDPQFVGQPPTSLTCESQRPTVQAAGQQVKCRQVFLAE